MQQTFRSAQAKQFFEETKIMKYLICVVASIFFAGCAFHEKSAVSVPVLAEHSFWDFGKYDNRVKLESLNIDIAPNNYTLISETAFLIIIPVYHSEKISSPKHKDISFKIRVALQPKRLGLSFAPQMTELKINGKITKPQGGSAYRMPEKEITKRVRNNVDAGSVFCTGEIESEDYTHEYFLLKNTDWYCYDLIFDAEVPSPKNDFSISLPGIYSDGARLDVPEIKFKASYFNSVATFP